ncbi:cytochrome c peroxidase [Chitinophaga niastensis]|uniref:Cytochrome c peroxidase n=1 Tax=Chitinophaga niastensis TaxID=536980 RepID=A0A2P8HRR1_CHINA|nr:cytochrome c peroxidase [Chitinophaga niastensis]PSL48929.1 cytochrome c peroxidase [Chitinophaga niastensis]
MNVLITNCYLFVFILLAACNGRPASIPASEQVQHYYLEHLKHTDSIVKQLNAAAMGNMSCTRLCQLFKEARQEYKHIEFLTEYLNPEMAKVINGPATPEVEEEDNVNTVIPPEGFQMIEGVLFPACRIKDSVMLRKLTSGLVASFTQTISISRNRLLSDSTVFKALRKELLRLSVLGLAGYDAPFSGHAIEEAAAVWSCFNDITEIYKERLIKAAPVDYGRIKGLIDSGSAYLKNNHDFDSFDRMHFLTVYANPLSGALLHVAQKSGIDLSDSYGPVKASAGSVFDKDAFTPDFYTSDVEEHSSKEKELLGRYLFFDPALSGNGKRACASCHQPGKAFADSFMKSPAINGRSVIHRNTVTMLNAALQPALFYDGRVTYLEDQITDVLSNADEMHGSIAKSIVMLRNSKAYMELFSKAFPQSRDPLTPYHLQNVIASYIRSLISLNAPFDRYMRGDHTQMNSEEVNGFNLYMGKAKCGTCHFAPLFNGALPPNFTKTEVEVIGVPQAAGSRKIDSDKGRYTLHPVAPYLYAFRTPTLRNVALTAPYMHNGIYYTLEEVLDFYNNSGGIGVGIALSNQTLPAERLNLTAEEKKNIISFLRKLTDTAAAHRLPDALPALDNEKGKPRMVNVYN